MVVGFADHENDTPEQQDIPAELPVLPLRNMVLFPRSIAPLVVGKPRSVKLIRETINDSGMLAVCTARDPAVENPLPGQIHETGTVCRVRSVIQMPEDKLQVILEGRERFRVDHWLTTEPYLRARVETAPETVEDGLELEALTRNLRELLEDILSFMSDVPEEAGKLIRQSDDPLYLVYMTAAIAHMDPEDGQRVLAMDSIKEKMRALVSHLTREREILTLGKKIRTDASKNISKQQREYMLREQLKAIKKELGEDQEFESTREEYEKRLKDAGLPKEARAEAERELKRLENVPPQSPEHALIRNYLDWMADLPWNTLSEDHLDIPSARTILDEDHYDLDDIKERILEFLAVRSRLKERGAESGDGGGYPATILCFAGPPGTGKTSLGRSIARAIGREFTRMSLGGLRDEAELRGHRRTYIGAMPGRIIQAVKRVGTRNPVFMLDEIDKVGADWRGDPSSALLEILDPAQNRAFRDNYLDVDFDLSDVMFITTANQLEPITAPLRDRMEILTLQGYTENEKICIARRYLVPRQIAANGLREDEVEFTDEALRATVRNYTRESGVRNLERQIGAVCRKGLVGITEGRQPPCVVTPDTVHDLLRRERFESERSETIEMPGIATALSVTAHGGEILFVEATGMPGKGELTLTGQLGEVMTESAKIARSYVRSQAKAMNIKPEIFNVTDVHLHVPAGAIPKDGPSAGVAMVLAIASLFCRRPVRGCAGMTGEITLRGRVLPVGGIKMKVLAAHRAGLTDVILPQRNQRDIEDIPPETRESMRFHFVDRIGEAIDRGITQPGESPAAPPAPGQPPQTTPRQPVPAHAQPPTSSE